MNISDKFGSFNDNKLGGRRNSDPNPAYHKIKKYLKTHKVFDLNAKISLN